MQVINRKKLKATSKTTSKTTIKRHANDNQTTIKRQQIRIIRIIRIIIMIRTFLMKQKKLKKHRLKSKMKCVNITMTTLRLNMNYFL